MPEPLRPCVRRVIRSIVLMCLGGLLPTAAVGQTIVWTDYNARRIQRKDVDGGEIGTILQFPSPQRALQIHYDPVTAKLYYRLSGAPTSLQRANLDGSDPENIPPPNGGYNFTLNVELRKLYSISGLGHNVLYRSELDGSGVESHSYGGDLETLEAVGDDLFLGAGGGGMLKGIWRADADGSNEQYLQPSPQPLDMAHDPVENKLYWAAYTQGINRMNTDGTGFEQVVSVASHGVQVVVDSRARKVYWGDRNAKVIRRSNLDGSNVEDFVTASDVGNPNFDIAGLTIVSPPRIPTLSGWGLMAMAVLLVGAGLVLLRKQINLRERQMCNTQGTRKVFGLFLSGVTAVLGSGGLWASEALAQ